MIPGLQEFLRHEEESPEHALGRFLQCWSSSNKQMPNRWAMMKEWCRRSWAFKDVTWQKLPDGTVRQDITTTQWLRNAFRNLVLKEVLYLETIPFVSKNEDVPGVFCVDIRFHMVYVVLGERVQGGRTFTIRVGSVETTGMYRLIQEDEQGEIGPGKWGVNVHSWRPDPELTIARKIDSK